MNTPMNTEPQAPISRPLFFRPTSGRLQLIGVFTLLGACIGAFLAALALPLLLLALWVKWAFGL